MKTAAVIGANGQLGSDVCKHFAAADYHVHALTHAHLDIEDALAVRDVLGSLRPDLVINTAAMHNVERCETEPERAFVVNAVGSRNVAQACREVGARLVQISTDYVFDGTKGSPYVETDMPRPLNVYAASKLAGEHAVLAEWERSFVVRVSGLYGRSPCRAKGGLSFVGKMLDFARTRPEIRVVDDEVLTPTHTADVARQLVRLVTTDAFGIVHATAEGACSWFEFAAHVLKAVGYRGILGRAEPGEFSGPVRRPKYSVLDNTVLGAAEIDVMPHWQDGLDTYLSLVLG